MVQTEGGLTSSPKPDTSKLESDLNEKMPNGIRANNVAKMGTAEPSGGAAVQKQSPARSGLIQQNARN